jgi:hypothetical protein
MQTECPVILYSRDGCHLCDYVAAMLDEAGVGWRAVDIDRDPRLAERYGLVIPVVAVAGSVRELAFPFAADELARFLEDANGG